MSHFIRSLWKVLAPYVYSSLRSKQISAPKTATHLNFHSSRNPKQCPPPHPPKKYSFSLLTPVARSCRSLSHLKHASKKQEDPCLSVGWQKAHFTKIPSSTHNSKPQYSENIQPFRSCFIHKARAELENVKDRDCLRVLPVSSAAGRWTRLRKPRHGTLPLPFPAQHAVTPAQVTE